MKLFSNLDNINEYIVNFDDIGEYKHRKCTLTQTHIDSAN